MKKKKKKQNEKEKIGKIVEEEKKWGGVGRHIGDDEKNTQWRKSRSVKRRDENIVINNVK